MQCRGYLCRERDFAELLQPTVQAHYRPCEGYQLIQPYDVNDLSRWHDPPQSLLSPLRQVAHRGGQVRQGFRSTDCHEAAVRRREPEPGADVLSRLPTQRDLARFLSQVRGYQFDSVRR